MTSGSGSVGTDQLGTSENKPLRSGDVHPRVRSAPTARHTLSVEELQTIRAMPYERYLQTALWHRRRNVALSQAKYRCSRCQVNRDLQVHHLSYERLGAELDEDLRVLCRGCHLGHHVNEVTVNRSVYLAIVSAALKAERFTCLADLIEEVKVRCAKLKIDYSAGQVQAAIARMDEGQRLGIQAPRKIVELLDEGRDNAPLTRAEAAGWMAKLGAIVKSIPSGPRFTRRQADGLLVIKNVYAPAAIESIQRCEEYERIAAEAEKAATETPS